ncbi:phage integrase SAM-like domain-containing protein [Soonwooa sp.]|uniref:tyrosine-type recombinase/integrase n=2 Tax=Soonwooa sp. TaxID=1938592 RepID=UPI0028AE28EB|nr:phage integrase SAM-like domain-containing protein [Soonwooa sp.]
MATTKLFLRVKNSPTPTTINLRINNGRSFDLTVRTPYKVISNEWDEQTQRRRNPFEKTTPRNPEGKQLKKEIETLNNNLTLLEVDFQNFITINPNASKDEVKKYIEDKYFPTKSANKKVATPKKNEIPELFSECIEFYIREKSKRITGKQIPISVATHKKLTTIKNNIIKYKKSLKLNQVDDNFRDNFTQWMQDLQYSSSTIIKDLKYIKSIIKHFSKKAKISIDPLNWEFITEKQDFTFPILSFKELEQIENTIYPHEYLENAKDWLIIGCYTGARVSDLLNFNHKNIIEDNLLQFSQKKIQNQTNDAEEIIFLHPKIIKILNKREGQFPRKISDQRFNEYIKIVAKTAGLTNIMLGGKIDKKTKKKKVEEYEKWELVTSHIMRRTFVTLFVGILDKDLIKTQTGHKTDEMVNHYDKTAKIDKAKQVREKFETILKIS